MQSYQHTTRNIPTANRIRAHMLEVLLATTASLILGLFQKTTAKDTRLILSSLRGGQAPGREHPTQKPVPLLEYLIKTYTNKNETVLDNTMGSGSTGVACMNTSRNFIGIELDAGYFEIAKRRIEESANEPRLDL